MQDIWGLDNLNDKYISKSLLTTFMERVIICNIIKNKKVQYIHYDETISWA